MMSFLKPAFPYVCTFVLFCTVLVPSEASSGSEYFRFFGDPRAETLKKLYFPELNENGAITLKANAPAGDIYRLMGLHEDGSWTLLERLNRLEALEDDVEVDFQKYVLSGIRCVRLDYSFESEDARARLDFYRRLWEANGPENYTLQQSHQGAFYSEKFLIEVEGDSVVSVSDWNWGTQVEESSWEYHSIDGLFDLIEQRIDACLDVRYDPLLGYPYSLNTNQIEWSVDLGYSFGTRLGIDSLELNTVPDWERFGASFMIGEVALWGERLYFDYSAKANCGPYEFQFSTDGTFVETSPPSIEVYVGFDGGARECTVFPSGREYLGIEALVERYQDVYGAEGPFTINLNTNVDGSEERVGAVLYVPELPELQSIETPSDLSMTEDAFLVTNVYLLLDDNTLEVDYRAPGSCSAGRVSLSSTLEFSETFPPEIEFVLRYDKNGDDCLGESFGKARFDMSTVSDEVIRVFGETGTVLLKLSTVVGGESFLDRKLTFYGERDLRATISSLDAVPDGFGEDPFELYNAEVHDYESFSELTILALVEGGCKEHSFSLSSDFAFKESNPVQLDLFLRHDSNGDTCDRKPWVYSKYNIAPILEDFEATYGDEASLVFNIISVVDGEQETIGQVTHTPL